MGQGLAIMAVAVAGDALSERTFPNGSPHTTD